MSEKSGAPVVWMTASGAPSGRPPFRDQSGLLVAIALLEILIGAGFALIGAGNVVFAFFSGRLSAVTAAGGFSSDSPLGRYLLLVSLVEYLGGAAFFIVIAVGTLRARRWARTLMLIVSWAWLVGGGIAMGLSAVVMPALLSQLPGTEDDPSLHGMAMAAILTFLAVFCVVLPGFFVIAYSGRNVRKTFERRHPEPTWTDGRPKSVLGLSLGLLLCGLAGLMSLPLGSMALFGTLLTGRAAVAAILITACLWIVMGRLIYGMTVRGWWANLAFAILMHASWALSIRAGAFDRLYGQLEIDPRMMQALRPFGARGAVAYLLVLASALIWIGGLVLLRRHFTGGKKPETKE